MDYLKTKLKLFKYLPIIFIIILLIIIIILSVLYSNKVKKLQDFDSLKIKLKSECNDKCNSEKTTLNNSLNTCNDDKTTLENSLNTCNVDKTTLNNSLNTCNNDKTTFDNSLNTCNDDKTTLENSLNTCNVNKTTLENSLNTCNVDKTTLENSLNTCNNNLSSIPIYQFLTTGDKWKLAGFVPGNGTYGTSIIQNSTNNIPISNTNIDTLNNCKINCNNTANCSQFTYDATNKICKLYGNTGINYSESNSVGQIYTYSKRY